MEARREVRRACRRKSLFQKGHTMKFSKYNPARGGHAPGYLREALHEALEVGGLDSWCAALNIEKTTLAFALATPVRPDGGVDFI